MNKRHFIKILAGSLISIPLSSRAAFSGFVPCKVCMQNSFKQQEELGGANLIIIAPRPTTTKTRQIRNLIGNMLEKYNVKIGYVSLSPESETTDIVRHFQMQWPDNVHIDYYDSDNLNSVLYKWVRTLNLKILFVDVNYLTDEMMDFQGIAYEIETISKLKELVDQHDVEVVLLCEREGAIYQRLERQIQSYGLKMNMVVNRHSEITALFYDNEPDWMHTQMNKVERLQDMIAKDIVTPISFAKKVDSRGIK